MLNNKTPYEILFGTPPSYNTICTFGCLCFAHNQKVKGDKFASRSRKYIFLGYPFWKKGWNLFYLDSNEFFVSRDAKFFEDAFPFLDPNSSNIIPENIVPTNVKVDYDFDDVCVGFDGNDYDDHNVQNVMYQDMSFGGGNGATTEHMDPASVRSAQAGDQATSDQQRFQATTDAHGQHSSENSSSV